MKQDCTVSQSTADETKRFQTSESNEFPEGTHVSEPDEMTGSVVEKCTEVKSSETEERTEKHELTSATQMGSNSKHPEKEDTNNKGEKHEPVSWCYLFVHHKKVKAFEEQLEKDKLTYFVHKTIKYVPRHRNRGSVREVEKPTVSGLIFIQGDSEKIQPQIRN